jgi:hypothetical protein
MRGLNAMGWETQHTVMDFLRLLEEFWEKKPLINRAATRKTSLTALIVIQI